MESGFCIFGTGPFKSGLSSATNVGGNGCAFSSASTDARDFLTPGTPLIVVPLISPCCAKEDFTIKTTTNSK